MRQLRDFKENMCYHLMSRVAHKAFYFNAEERTRFVERMWRVAVFSGMTVLAYCIMSNHFHILIHAPAPVPLSDEELMRRIRVLYYGERLAEIEAEWDRVAAHPDDKEEFRQRFLRRMWNVSEFMKTLKQDVTMSINGRTVHVETMWGARFRAVEYNSADKRTLGIVAAYIDRNPVKAKMVTWPDAYLWCGFAAACAGDERCVSGYASLYPTEGPVDWEEIREAHGMRIASVLREWESECGETPTELDLFVSGKKKGKVLPRGIENEDAARWGRFPSLVGRGSDKVAFEILVLLSKRFLGPAELRRELGFKNADFFTSRYLTPMESSGLIEIANNCPRRSAAKKFRPTERGFAILETYSALI